MFCLEFPLASQTERAVAWYRVSVELLLNVYLLCQVPWSKPLVTGELSVSALTQFDDNYILELSETFRLKCDMRDRMLRSNENTTIEIK